MNRRTSESFVCRLDVQSATDMEKLQVIKSAVSAMNRQVDRKLRVVTKGRKPFVKMKAAGGFFNPPSKNPVAYDVFGNIVGGIANASMIDVYLYKRS
jgi:hypothetical protein